MAHFRVVLLFAICCCITTIPIQKGSDYSLRETRAALRPDKPLYENATAPAQRLDLNGFPLKRGPESNTVQLSGAEKRAALYKTTHGEFQVVFLKKPQIFGTESLRRQENGRGIWWFEDSPRFRPAYKDANERHEKLTTRPDDVLDKTAFPTCPVTKPNGTADPTEYGNGELRTTLWPKGTVEFRPGGPGEIYEDGSMAMKWGWLRAVSGKLAIEGRRLDKPARPLRANVPDGYGDIGFQSTLLIFPTEGCWEITGKLSRARLTFVTRVVKISEGN